MEPKYTLKLDASYRPIEIIPIHKGFNMVYCGRAKRLESYHTGPTRNTLYPSVIVLKTYISKRRLTIACNRRNVIWRDKNTCQYCGGVFLFKDLTMDHVYPRCKGGKKSWDNIVASCKRCNSRKGYKTIEEFGKKPLTNPKKPAITIREYYRNIPFPQSWDRYI